MGLSDQRKLYLWYETQWKMNVGFQNPVQIHTHSMPSCVAKEEVFEGWLSQRLQTPQSAVVRAMAG